MNKWLLIHRYNSLVRQGEARPFLCPNCEERLAVLPDVNDEPVLWCPFDDSGFTPGSMFWADVNSVVGEFYVA